MRRADPHRALTRVLLTRYPALQVLQSSAEPWASATFTGARHVLVCAGGPDLTGVDEVDLPLSGHIVADIVAGMVKDRIVIEALTVEAD